MRVAFLSVSAEMGGSERVLVDLVRGLGDAHGTQSTVVLPREGPLADAVRRRGGDTSILPMPEALATFGELNVWENAPTSYLHAWGAAAAVRSYTRGLAARLAAIDPDVVHSNGLKFHVLAARARCSAPVVWHMHEYLGKRRLSQLLLRRHVSRVAALIANSQSVAGDAKVHLTPTAAVHTVYNGVNLDEYAPNGTVADLDGLCGMREPPAGTVRIGLVGTYGRWKGHETFLRALRGLPGSWRAYIVGGPVYDTRGSQYSRDELMRIAGGEGIAHRLGVTGWLARPAEAMRALDIVVHASTRPEPFGLVIAEAMGCGRTVVVSAAGGAAELVTDGVDALTHRPGDAQGLRDALARAIADASLRRRLGKAARRAAEHRFDLRHVVEQVATIYRSVIAGAAVTS